MKVITYQAPNGEKINLTQAQIQSLEANGVWPKNSQGEEYCSISKGLHQGTAAAGGSTDVTTLLTSRRR